MKDKPVATIGNNRLTFNTVSLKKFEDVEYVELLLNTVEKCIAVRPCKSDSPNAIRWGRKKDGKWIPSQRTISGFAAALYTIAGWDKDNRYRLCGQYFSDGSDQMLVFDLSEPEIIRLVKKGEYQAREEGGVDQTRRKSEAMDGDGDMEIVTVYSLEKAYPDNWVGHFGDSAKVAGFERIPYSGNWEILRPARTYATAGGMRQEIIHEIETEAQKMLQGLGLAI